ncbi:MAG: VanW family protein [Fimbriimonadales bacterium]|nr:VanW family protein [Fimbriimonadales bacterium]
MRWIWAPVACLSIVAAIACLSAYRHQERLRGNAFVGPVSVGELTPEEARKRLRVWWEAEKVRTVGLTVDPGKVVLRRKLSELVRLDDRASVERVPSLGFWESVADRLDPSTPEPLRVEPVLVFHADLQAIRREAHRLLPQGSPARATFERGSIVRQPERPGLTVDSERLPETVAAVVASGADSAPLPIVLAEKRVPDEALEQIAEVAAEFKTRFPRSNKPRNANIRAASRKIDGWVLMPGERFSFNGVVGKRTIDKGFREAGIYVNGRHDTGVGGGICQVSTTLYNAALLANLKIVRRANHSLPVPYAPVGRDATVNYGSQDLVVENSTEGPIALSLEVGPGVLHARVLGRRDPDMEVKVLSRTLKSWNPGVKYVPDPTLPKGKQAVIEKGGMGCSVVTERWILRAGRVVAKESLGRSTYKGGPKIIAVGTGTVPEANPRAETAQATE